ncbi:hypothetical protein LINPERHAP2_LOCUS14279 [Linum perenne]
MFPITWAVVESENKHSWRWFLELLQEEFELDDGTGWSVILDQQKDLVDSLQELLPLVEHRKCAQHVYVNWKIKHKSAARRKAFWDVVYVFFYDGEASQWVALRASSPKVKLRSCIRDRPPCRTFSHRRYRQSPATSSSCPC